MTRFAYAGEILEVDLSSGSINKIPSAPYTERFLGGRGLAAKIYWDTVPIAARAYDPENCLIYATGPVTGYTRIAGGCRWQVCAKSPVTVPESFSYANLGERWGTRLKYAGYDALVVRGKADRPVYIYIRDDKVEMCDAASLWGKFAIEAGDSLKAELGQDVSVLTIGPAAENLVPFATMLTDDGASGASGLGSVMGSKNLKAIAVAGERQLQAADPAGLENLARRIQLLRKDTWKNWLDDVPGRTKLRACYGCPSGCFRKSYVEAGRRYKFFCQATHVYWPEGERDGQESAEIAMLAVRLCDRYGLDTTILRPLIDWMADCYREGVLHDNDLELPLSKIGTGEFIELLTRKIALREGSGDVMAQGIIETAAQVGGRAQELSHLHVVTRASETRDYDPRLILTNALLYATEPRRPINQLHETSHSLWLWCNWTNKLEGAFLSYNDFLNIGKNFWGSAAGADYSTYEGKALAAKKIQDRTYAKESLILCDFLWPIIWVRFAEDHSGDPAMESRVLSAITGQKTDEAGLNRIGERIFNLQRAILLREGRGSRQGDKLLDYLHEEPLPFAFFNPECIVPGKNGQVVSRKGARLPRADFENMKSEYYGLRGWDTESGLLTEKILGELELNDIAADLKTRGLLR
jgi:aldehyde:ferredoxin oxidoreductase